MNELASSNLKVLIVEDSPVVSARVKSMLSELQEINLVGEAMNSKEALIITDIMLPDVVLLDISIPGKSGMHVLKEIKKNYLYTKVIMLTTYTESYYRNVCRELGADYFFDKATEFDKVPEALISILQEKRIAKVESNSTYEK